MTTIAELSKILKPSTHLSFFTLCANFLAEIKEAITKQDIRDLLKSRAIIVKEIKGKLKRVKRKTRRREGSLKKKVKRTKKDYMAITRKLRVFISELILVDVCKYYRLTCFDFIIELGFGHSI